MPFPKYPERTIAEIIQTLRENAYAAAEANNGATGGADYTPDQFRSWADAEVLEREFGKGKG